LPDAGYEIQDAKSDRQNPKLEIRNKSQIFESRNEQNGFRFEIFFLEHLLIVSNFVIRISDRRNRIGLERQLAVTAT